MTYWPRGIYVSSEGERQRIATYEPLSSFEAAMRQFETWMNDYEFDLVEAYIDEKEDSGKLNETKAIPIKEAKLLDGDVPIYRLNNRGRGVVALIRRDEGDKDAFLIGVGEFIGEYDMDRDHEDFRWLFQIQVPNRHVALKFIDAFQRMAYQMEQEEV